MAGSSLASPLDYLSETLLSPLHYQANWVATVLLSSVVPPSVIVDVYLAIPTNHQVKLLLFMVTLPDLLNANKPLKHNKSSQTSPDSYIPAIHYLLPQH